MTKRHTLFCCFFFGSLLAVLLTGCGSTQPPITYYNLTPMAAVQNQQYSAGVQKPLAIGIDPVIFPEALDQIQLAYRLDSQRLMYDDFHRWSGSLVNDFTRVLMENLASQLPKQSTIAIFPWGSYFKPSYRLVLNVIQFDGKLGDEVGLSARWTVTNASGKEAILTQKSVIRVKTAGKEYQDLVAALSQAVADLSGEIANCILAESVKTGKID